MAEPITLALRGPGGEPVDLWRTLTSHGFFDLPPLRVDEEARTLDVTLRPDARAPRRVRSPGRRLRHRRGRAARPEDGLPRHTRRARDRRRPRLRLDQDLSAFYAKAAADSDLDWVRSGAGRMLRSPTVWEDVVKTVCTTNCSWSLTTTMVKALVTHLGEPVAGHDEDPLTNAFPTAEAMAAQDETFYRQVVRAGYRAPSFVRLAELVAGGEADLEALGAASREDLPGRRGRGTLLALPGVGPYAAAHVMMTLGRNSRLILDSWTRPTYARIVGRRTPPADAAIVRRFRRYGPDAGLAFWLFVTKHWVE